MSAERGTAVSREQDQAFIKTFIGVIGILVAITIVLIIIANFTTEGVDQEYGQLQAERTTKRLQPIGQVRVTGEAMPEIAQPQQQKQSKPRSGKEVVQAICSGCHTTNFQNAPQIGDTKAWSERASKGLDTLEKHASQGFGNMPAQGGSASDKEIREAIIYMAKQSDVDVGK